MIRETSSVAVRLATTAAGRRLASTYLVFLAGVTGITGVVGITGEFERSLFSVVWMFRRSRNEENTISQTCLKEIGGLLISDLPQGSHTTAKATLKIFGRLFIKSRKEEGRKEESREEKHINLKLKE